ncbi:MAG: hypothetical protein U9N62_07765 [Thermotogota bacterium]|nr:hypothetical protein [Thermotogota bacterium]
MKLSAFSEGAVPLVLLGLSLLDHIIFNAKDYYSFVENDII